VSVLADVLTEARRGRSATAIAAGLGLDVGVVDAALDHAERLGLVVPAASIIGCGGCAAPEPAAAATHAPAPASCRGCPLVGTRQATGTGVPRTR
jgi:hypothetical protein